MPQFIFLHEETSQISGKGKVIQRMMLEKLLINLKGGDSLPDSSKGFYKQNPFIKSLLKYLE